MDKTENKQTDQFLKTDGGKTKSNAVEVPSISLPKGGGAIKGIDEKFSVNAVNGTSSFSIPLPVSQARGASPSISLSYNSGAGNGIFGLGWNLSLPSIKRKTDKGLPQYFDNLESDVFLFSEAEDLVPEFEKLRKTDGSFEFKLDSFGKFKNFEKPISDATTGKQYTIRYYRPRIEGLFARIERWTEIESGKIKWRIITKDNVTTLFGWTENARIFDSSDNTRIFEWLPEFVFDDKGNCSYYVYKPEDQTGFDTNALHNKNRIRNNELTYANRYLEKNFYGNKTPYKKFGDPFPLETDFLFETVFDYGITEEGESPEILNPWEFRTDAFSDYKAGFEIRTTRLCRRVLLFHHFDEYNGLIKSMNFKYDTDTQKDFTFLKSITAHGYIKTGTTYSQKNLPSTEFTYQKHEWNKEVKSISTENVVHAPSGLDEQQYQFTDLFNEGLSGILTEQANGWYYKHNLGDGKFERAKLITPKPSFIGLGAQLHLADLDADGGKQLVNYSTEPKGYFELDDEDEWQPFKDFQRLPNVNFADSNTRMLDLNGDGKPEVLISEDNIFNWYESEGRNGFSHAKTTPKSYDEEIGPHIIFADLEQSIFLADMSGDGLTDIVRIRNGEVCYWPNLGYGKFGAKVAMENAPLFDNPDAFNPAYLRLADIDGSGTTDFIYLGKNKFICWSNFSGNSFSKLPFEINAFPEIHSHSKISVTDLLGNGVACIVWSSSLSIDANAPLKYIDLMNSKKPHIMIGYKNNMGKEVSMEYAPSTKFYIEDKLAGKPWITKLHFPVHCISKTETVDKISGWRFVSSFKYHHGYYDHPEREFRGFGMVEQTDTEDFELWQMSGATNVTDLGLHQSPVISKTWIHTGAFLEREKILNQFEKEYWSEEMKRQGFELTSQEHELPLAKIIDENGVDLIETEQLTVQDWHEALRACKGMALRSEVFSKNEDLKKELTPYNVATHNCIIQRLQPKGHNQHAIFIVKESEAITYAYEQSIFKSNSGNGWETDPRISHRLNIKFDEYANALEAASVVYPRKWINTIPAQLRIEAQDETFISFVENKFTNDIDGRFDLTEPDVFRLRAPSEVKTYQLKGVPKSGAYYSINDFEDILNNSKSYIVDYHQFNEPILAGLAQRRLIEHVCTIYRNNNLIDQLPFGEMHSLGIPYESYQLAYTPALLIDIYGAKANDSLMVEGKFAHNMGDNNWWIPSGTINFIDANNPESNTLAKAQSRFYLPISYADPYGSKTNVKYYGNYFLFVEETEDALGNKSSVDLFNFRTLSPQRMKDLNDNLSEAISDELGLVKAFAIIGKEAQADDLDLLTEETSETEHALINDFFAIANAEGICNSSDLQTDAKDLLKHASARFIYDLNEYTNRGKPLVVASIARETHHRDEEGSLNPESELQISFEYSSGLGNVIMKKTQAEPGKAKLLIVDASNHVIQTVPDPDTTPYLRWIGNGRTILNNKGNAVKQYEPFFSVSPKFEDEKELVETGVTPIMYYDAIGRLIKTEMPDGTFSKVEFDSWQQSVYDANDTVMDSEWYSKRIILPPTDPERISAEKAKMHYNTPSHLHFDTLGRPVLQIENNGKDLSNADVLFKTKVDLDIEGNLRKVMDARELPENNNLGNIVMQYKYDMLGNLVYQKSMDAGERWLMLNILGQPLKTCDALGHVFEFKYNDNLHRPTEKIATGIEGSISTPYTTEKIIYGESLADSKVRNLRGQTYQHFDSSGLIQSERIDFKGNLLEVKKRLTNQYTANAIDWSVNPISKLETEEFVKTTAYDALNRIVSTHNWHSLQTRTGIYTLQYNERSLLVSQNLTIGNQIQEAIRSITYNEKGQHLSQQLGCYTTTQYIYDAETFRLISMRTSPPGGGNNSLQNLIYTYDPVGNITQIEDRAYEPIFFNNQMVEAKSTFTYDALYRLTEATGRENSLLDLPPKQRDNQWNDISFPINDTNALRNYTQKYVYDQVGNILEMSHKAGNGSQIQRWTRNYEYETNNNRLKNTYTGNDRTTQINYEHDLHGNIKNLGLTTNELVWNYNDMIQSANLEGGGSSWYNYGEDKQRSRKRILKAGITEDRIYLKGFEIYRRLQGSILLENIETHHLFAGNERVLMAEDIRKTDNNHLSTGILNRYQFGNHLGSVGLELNENAEIISYEEYHPYGTTAYQAKNVAINAIAKRYRYTGMERDEETGLAYHSARYYIPWLGRWMSKDIVNSNHSFNYTNNNPINLIDTNGQIPGCAGNKFCTYDNENENDFRQYAMIMEENIGKDWYMPGNDEYKQEVKDWIAEKNYNEKASRFQKIKDSSKLGVGLVVDKALNSKVASKAGAVVNTIEEGIEVQTKAFDRSTGSIAYGMVGGGKGSMNSVTAYKDQSAFQKSQEIVGPSLRAGAEAGINAVLIIGDVKATASVANTVVDTASALAKSAKIRLRAIIASALRANLRKMWGKDSAVIIEAIESRHLLRTNIGLGVGNPFQAHHVVPVEVLKANRVAQSAVVGGFDFNGYANAIKLEGNIHLTGHSEYNKLLMERLNSWAKQNPGYTPGQARAFLEKEIVPEWRKNFVEVFTK